MSKYLHKTNYGKNKTFKELIVWQKSHKLVLEIYRTTKSYPKEEVYALTSQIRRASVSIAANISEGYKKKTKASKLNFLNISEGSLEEVKYYILLSKDLEYITEKEYDNLENMCNEVGRLINGYSIGVSKNN
ncbi:MAG: four helix bundle protein [Bacteroidetes bacterium]|nr:four helix bundle protein [Bacteroidota bacterium]